MSGTGQQRGAAGAPDRALLARDRAERLAAQLPPLLVAAQQVAATVAQGVHGRRRVGAGETFWQFRRYQSGDSAGRIDWRQSAKSQPLFVRENEWDAAQSVWLWCDRSASMEYRSIPTLPPKGERATVLLLALAELLIRGGERVALLNRRERPQSGRHTLLRLAECLTAPATAAEATFGLPQTEPLPRHGRVVLFSDLMTPLAELQTAIAGLSRQGIRGHLVQVLDPAEETLPFTGRIVFADPEGEAPVLIPRVEAVREAYHQRLAAHCEGVATLVRAANWTLVTHRTDHQPQTALLALYAALAMQTGPGICA